LTASNHGRLTRSTKLTDGGKKGARDIIPNERSLCG